MNTIWDKTRRRGGDICAIVVHAGAGYHSIANQDVHLAACNDACRAAMACLNNYGTAVEAVEVAIKVLEDREITNAGYGSNLAMDGVVECDALVVDHMGRSGAVGACPQIKNPISLARLVLDKSLGQLTLRRVPPNLLVSQGAVEFAQETGVPVLPYDALVSPSAHERWVRWTQDLRRAERRKLHKQGIEAGPYPLTSTLSDPLMGDIRENRAREAHTANLLRHINKKKRMAPPSPDTGPTHRHSTPITSFSSTTANNDTSGVTLDDEGEAYVDLAGPPGSIHEASTSAFINSSQNIPTLLTLSEADIIKSISPSIEGSADEPPDVDIIDHGFLECRGAIDKDKDSDSSSTSSDSTLQLPSITPSPPGSPNLQGDGNVSIDMTTAAMTALDFVTPFQEDSARPASPSNSTPVAQATEHSSPPLSLHASSRFGKADNESEDSPLLFDKQDEITDTVGAIAIDCYGNIASGASSGGIGMKHRGRCGPAALVGVGAAVVPIHVYDKTKTCVSAVTSGTGEHMGTTLAASVCADRLYNGMQKTKDGPLEITEDSNVLRSFIEREFMLHPSVKHSNSAGAIGVVTLKKTRDAVWLYFAHNTDSFALASMSTEDNEPVCAMSRTRGNGSIAEGARAIRHPRKSK